jgi:hypothetical protein
MQKQSDSPLPALVLSPSISASDARAASREALGEKLRIIAATMALLLVLYVGSYLATAFATGAGWMEVGTRHWIVWTVYWPISKCAVSERHPGPRYLNDANGWFFTIGWRWLHK